MPLAAFYSITVLANLHTRKRLQATLDAPIPLKITSFSIKNRMAWNRGDHGDARRLQATRTNIAREVVNDDVHMKPKNIDTKVQFTEVPRPVLGGPEPEPEPKHPR